MPPALREKIESAAEKSRRSLNAEIVGRLEDSFATPDYSVKEPPRVVTYSQGVEEQAPNESLLQNVLEVVEEISAERGLVLPPGKKAHLIKLIYDEISESVENKTINKSRVVSLLKLAS